MPDDTDRIPVRIFLSGKDLPGVTAADCGRHRDVL